MEHTDVLIVGGSLVGLSAALFLSWRGVRTVVLEKHPGSSKHPRATGFTERTLEYFRAVGIADQILEVDPGTRLRRVKADSLSGVWHEETAWTPGEDGVFGQKSSPCRGAAIAQDRLEPILRARAVANGAALRLGVKMMSFEQADDRIVAQVCDRERARKYAISADYMIAADGADSPVREALGIKRHGVGQVRTLRSVLFRCPAADTVLGRGVQQFQIEQSDFSAFLTSYGDGRWVLMFDDDLERSNAELAAAVQKALGHEMTFEIITTGRWEMAGRIAEKYNKGRVFLAGDAAHQLPPTRGGFGANTGIDDVYNLAWKLEWVVKGRSKPTLLDTYSDERQPIGWLRHQQTFARPDYASWVGNALDGEGLYSNEAMELGQLVRSTAVVGAGPELPPAAAPAEWKGQPGTRAPHAWIEEAETASKRSTIDLFTRSFVVISSDPGWIDAAKVVAGRLGIEVRGIHVGKDVTFCGANFFHQQFGIASDGAAMVRPDGIVAWRSTTMAASPSSVLQDVLVRVAAYNSLPQKILAG